MARFTGHAGVKLSLNGGDRTSFGCEMRDHIRLRVPHGRRRLLERSAGIHRRRASHDHGRTVRVWSVGNKLSGSKGDDFVKDSDVFYDLDEDSDDYDEEEDEDEELDDSEFDELSYFRGLVLDISYRPVNVVCWKRAICLEFMEKADVLEYYDQTVSSPQGSFFIPAVLRVRHLLQVVQRRRIKQVLSRKSIFYRDSYTCQYCSARENLTIDHILPVAKGGGWTWENLVAACAKCNSKKGQKTLEQANMKLLKTPKAPKDYDIFTIPLTSAAARMLKKRSRVPEEWEQYLPNQLINHAMDEAHESKK